MAEDALPFHAQVAIIGQQRESLTLQREPVVAEPASQQLNGSFGMQAVSLPCDIELAVVVKDIRVDGLVGPFQQRPVVGVWSGGLRCRGHTDTRRTVAAVARCVVAIVSVAVVEQLGSPEGAHRPLRPLVEDMPHAVPMHQVARHKDGIHLCRVARCACRIVFASHAYHCRVRHVLPNDRVLIRLHLPVARCGRQHQQCCCERKDMSLHAYLL